VDRIHDLTTDRIRKYIDSRFAESAEAATDWKSRDLKYVGLIFNDMRRTAVPNMVRARISERVAMTIRGHKTRSVFDRYHIVAPSGLRDAACKLETSQSLERQALEKSRAPEFGQTLGIVAKNSTKNEAAARLQLTAAGLPNWLAVNGLSGARRRNRTVTSC